MLWVTTTSTYANADLIERRAYGLFVGVSDYPDINDDSIVPLEGPPNDLALMYRSMLGAGIASQNITVLADRVAQNVSIDGLPTRINILHQFETMVGRSKPGVTFLIYMTGHGAQQVEEMSGGSRREADGLDEVFLPLDVGAWSQEKKSFKNAILDNEIGSAIDRMVAKGAFVWLIVDSCNSGSIDRSRPTERLRFVPTTVPADARTIPSAALRGLDRTSDPITDSQAPKGLVAFFASHGDEAAVEGLFPKSKDAASRRIFGMFTFYLGEALAEGRHSTYRDLAYRVLSRIERHGASAPTPLFKGNLDQNLPFAVGGDTRRRWPVTETNGSIRVEAGAFDGISQGMLLLVKEQQGGKWRDAFYARAIEVSGASAQLKPLAHKGLALPKRRAFSPYRVAEITEADASFDVSVAISDGQRSTKSNALVDKVLETVERGASFNFTDGTPELWPDIEVKQDAGVVMLMQNMFDQSTEFPATLRMKQSGFGPVESDVIRIRQNLAQLVAARNLLRVAAELNANPIFEKITVRLHLDQNKSASDHCVPPQLAHVPSSAELLDRSAQDGLSVPSVYHCDTLYVEISHRHHLPVDMTPLYIDGAGGMSYVGDPRRVRLNPGDPPLLLPLTIHARDPVTGKALPTGVERLVILAVVRPERSSIPLDFSYLASFQSLGDRSVARAHPFSRTLNAAVFGLEDRSVGNAHLDTNSGARVLAWRVVPDITATPEAKAIKDCLFFGCDEP